MKNVKDVAGKYNADPEAYKALAEKVYRDFAPIVLGPEYAQFVEKNLLQFLIRLSRYKFAAKLLGQSDDVLEVGSGTGLGSIFLSQFCARVTGIEIKSGEVAEAANILRRDNVEFVCGDFFDYPKDRVHDAVVSLDVIEHLEPDVGVRFVEAMSRHVDPAGMAIIGSPSVYSYPYQSDISKASHVKCYDLPELKSLVGRFFGRTISFSMNDEVVHTGYHKLAWYYFVIGFCPRQSRA